MSTLEQHFHQFLRERVYLHNVTPKTREYYLAVWKAFTRAQKDTVPRSEGTALLTRSDLQSFVVHLRERGVKAVTCNCWLRGMNAVGRWLHTEGIIPEPVRLRPQKEEKRLLPLHNEAAIRALIGYRPSCRRFRPIRHWPGHFRDRRGPVHGDRTDFCC